MTKNKLASKIFIGNKEISKYITACLYEFSEGRNLVQITGRGNNIKRSVDVADILLRKYLDVPKELPNLNDVLNALDNNDISAARDLIRKLMICEIKINSEEFENRHVSTIDIILRGKKRKDAESI